MHRNCLLPLLLLLFSTPGFTQQFKVHGKISTNKMEPLAYASVEVKELRSGTTSKQDGTFELFLGEGKYDLVFSMVGYATQVITIVVKGNYVQNVIMMENDSRNLSEVVVKGKSRDRAEEVIRNVIRNKEKVLAAGVPYSCLIYIKAVQQDSASSIKKRTPDDTARKDNGVSEFRQMAMTEISLTLDFESESRTKEERTGVKRIGNPDRLFFLRTSDGNFNFYNNLVRAPAISAMPFLSPISYSGLIAYKFKTIKVQQSGNHKIFTISVKPRQLSNATVSGEVTISDSSWTILHTHFIFPKYHLPEYDYFDVRQDYSFIGDSASMLTRQHFTYNSKTGKGKLSGETIVTYKNYQLNKTFPKKHFGTELSATTEQAYRQDSSFWQTVRTEPLTDKEIRFINYSDSLYRATHTKQYLDSIDKITNRITWKKVGYLGQTFYNREKERRWNLPPLVSLYQPLAYGGARINPSVWYSKTYRSRKNISLFANVSYGIRNKDLNGSLRVSRMYNPFNRGFYTVSAGREFNYIFQGDAWINMIKRDNYYLHNYIRGGHGLELANGLFLYNEMEFAARRSVSRYKTNPLIDTLLQDVFTDNHAVSFESYNAFYNTIRLQFTPGQRFLREPKEKIILGSKWPTFYTAWKKGIPKILESKIDFDYLEFGMEQEITFGLAGISRYNIKTGSFIRIKDLRLVDYKFQRRGDPLLYMNPDEAFQALDSSFAVFKRFYQGHYVHEFNGMLINKIPLLKKLQLREVAGAGFLIAPERNLRYAETFAGIERAFKWPFNPLTKFKLGVYVVGSVANKFSNPVQFKIGVTTWDKQRNRWY